MEDQGQLATGRRHMAGGLQSASAWHHVDNQVTPTALRISSSAPLLDLPVPFKAVIRNRLSSFFVQDATTPQS